MTGPDRGSERTLNHTGVESFQQELTIISLPKTLRRIKLISQLINQAIENLGWKNRWRAKRYKPWESPSFQYIPLSDEDPSNLSGKQAHLKHSSPIDHASIFKSIVLYLLLASNIKVGIKKVHLLHRVYASCFTTLQLRIPVKTKLSWGLLYFFKRFKEVSYHKSSHWEDNLWGGIIYFEVPPATSDANAASNSELMARLRCTSLHIGIDEVHSLL